MLMPKYAGRCLKPAQDRGPELADKCSILALDPLPWFGGLDCDGIGIDELAVARHNRSPDDQFRRPVLGFVASWGGTERPPEYPSGLLIRRLAILRVAR